MIIMFVIIMMMMMTMVVVVVMMMMTITTTAKNDDKFVTAQQAKFHTGSVLKPSELFEMRKLFLTLSFTEMYQKDANILKTFELVI